MEFNETKEELRKRILDVRRNIGEDCERKSKKIMKILLGLREYQDARIVMSYISLNDEVDTRFFLKMELDKREKLFLVPFVEENRIKVSVIKNFNELGRGKHNTLEPLVKREYDGKIDLIVVPGIVFDEAHRRIGFGRGYYDYFLKDYRDSFKVGLAFEEQMVWWLPSEKHDVKMNCVITDLRFF